MQNQNSTTPASTQDLFYPARQEHSKLPTQYMWYPLHYRDSGIKSLMDPRAWMVYDALRSYIWRNENRAHTEEAFLLERGYVITSITQQRLLTELNIGELRTLQRQLEYLESELGWIRRYRASTRAANLYILGFKRKVEDTGEYVEELFGDIWAGLVMKEAPEYVELGVYPAIVDVVRGVTLRLRSRILDKYYTVAGLPPYISNRSISPIDLK